MSVSFGTQAQGRTLGISKTFCDHHGGLGNGERPVSIGFN
jgi:glycine cleavage system protein P-like pyridoxal-binding family